MRDPLHVRASELRVLFADRVDGGVGPVDTPVFTLDHRQYAHDLADNDRYRDDGLPERLRRLIESLSGTQAVLAVFASERTHPREAHLGGSLGRVHQAFSEHLARQPKTRREVRTLAFFRFLADLATEPMEIAL